MSTPPSSPRVPSGLRPGRSIVGGQGSRRGRGAGAFTLLEVMLAIAVASIVLIAVTGVFFGALKLRNRTSAAIEESHPLERALSRIRRDLAGIVPPGGTLGGAFQAGNGVSMGTNSVSPQFGQAGPEFRTCTGTIGEGLPWSEVQRVAYLLLESTNRTGGRDLVRSVHRNLLSPSEENPDTEWLLGNVESLVFRYHDGSQWLDLWDSTAETNQLPRAIKLELQRAPAEVRGPLPPIIELVVPLLADGNTNHTPETTNASTSGSGGGGGAGGAP